MSKLISALLLMLATGLFVQAQTSLDLTANECFFTPIGTLENVEDPNQTGNIANNGRFFTHVTNWRVPTDTIVWAVDIEQAGSLTITPVMGVGTNQANSAIDIVFGGQVQMRSLTQAEGYGSFRSQPSASFEVSVPGRYLVELTLNTPVVSGSNVADVQKLELTGAAAEGASVVIKRWRPSAVHGRWHSSGNPEEVVLAIHQNTIATTHIDMYQPITTPFGYYGSTWSADNQRFDGINFSLWSYGQNDSVPPIEEFSHLIAVGPGLEFGEYGHEGTGVKPRGDSPYLEHDVTTQILALRMEPGEYYDTYYGYYLNPETEEWEFYGAGKKYNQSGRIRYLTTGAFVEQPGVPARQRSGHVMREVHYGGWLMDKQDQWYNIDQMVPGGSLSPISYKNWGVTEDNEFYMQMGGFRENDHQPNLLELDGLPPVAERPVYLQPEMLQALYRLPAIIDTLAPKEVGATNMVVQFDIQNAGTNPVAELFWGQQEGLTFDYQWENRKVISLAEGITEETIEDLVPRETYRYRLRIINEEGITWSMHTQSFQTKEPDGVFADFEVSQQAIFSGQSVAFTNKSFPEEGSLQWSFPGGNPSSSTQQSPVVTYHQPGVYDVSLTVSDGSGKQDTKVVPGCISVSEIQEGNNLDVYIDFRKNLLDLSGNNHHGLVVGGSGHHEGSGNIMNYTYDDERGWVGSLDGRTELELADYYGIEGGQSRTMTAWVNTTHNDLVIVNWGRARTGGKNTFKIDADGYLRFAIAGGFISATSTVVNDGQWHHIACVFENSESPNVEDVLLYVNGNAEETTANALPLDTEAFRLATIGNDIFDQYYEGLLSDVRIYSRALSAEEVNTLAEDGEIDTSIPPQVKADEWVAVKAVPGEHQIEIRLHAATDAQVSVYDISGVLIKRRRISPGTTSLYRPGGNRIAVLLIQHNDNKPYAEKVFW